MVAKSRYILPTPSLRRIFPSVSCAFTERPDSFSARFAVARERPEERGIERFGATLCVANNDLEAERRLLISSKRREDGSRIRNDIAALRRGAAETRARPFYRFNFHGERGSGRITIRAGKNESAEIRSAFRSTRSLRQSVGRQKGAAVSYGGSWQFAFSFFKHRRVPGFVRCPFYRCAARPRIFY